MFFCFCSLACSSSWFNKDNVLLLGLWFGSGKPCMTTYLQPIARKLNNLMENGITINPTSRTPSLCRVYLLSATMDLPAMAMVRDMHQFNGEFGCGMCEEPGVSVAKGRGQCRTYPPPTSMNNIIHRTKESVLQQAHQASETGKVIKGIKGLSCLLLLRNCDPVKQVLIDYLHGVCLGVMKNLFSYWFDPGYKRSDFWIGDQLDTIDSRLLSIKPTEEITRPPRSIRKERSHFKASEYRNFLLLYGAHVLEDILPEDFYLHFLMLSRGISILLGHEISPLDLEEASNLLLQFYCLYGAYYSQDGWSLNVHNTGVHIVECVRLGGPLWAFGCFGFESFCGEYVKMIHGTQHIALQIISAFRAIRHLRASMKVAFTTSPEVDAVLNGKPRVKEKIGQTEEDHFRVSALQNVSEQNIIDLVNVDDTQLKQFGKLMKGHYKITGQNHECSKRRSNASIEFIARDRRPGFGIVQTFLIVSDKAFAVVAEMHQTECHHKVSAAALTDHQLKDNVLYKHVIPVALTGRQILLEVSNITRKVLLIQSDEHFHVIRQPNEYEHD